MPVPILTILCQFSSGPIGTRLFGFGLTGGTLGSVIGRGCNQSINTPPTFDLDSFSWESPARVHACTCTLVSPYQPHEDCTHRIGRRLQLDDSLFQVRRSKILKLIS